MLQLFTVPAANDRGPRYMERALAAIHQSCRPGETLTLAYASVDGRVGLILGLPESQREQIAGPILAGYPNGSLTTVAAVDAPPAQWETWSLDLVLTPEVFPILRHAQFEDPMRKSAADPVAAVLRAVQPDPDAHCRVEIVVAPASAQRRRRAAETVRLLDREFFRKRHRLAHRFAARAARVPRRLDVLLLRLIAKRSPHRHRSAIDTSANRQHDREEHLQAASDKVGGHLFEASIRLLACVPPGGRSRAEERLRQLAGAFGAFTNTNLATFRRTPLRRGNALAAPTQLLSHEELATLFSPPTVGASVERLQTTAVVEFEPPPAFPFGDEPDAIALGRVRFRDDDRSIGLAIPDRRRHLYAVGATGAGKSTLLLNLIAQDMRAGRGVTLIDVHGDLADAVQALVPRSRMRDLVVVDPASDAAVSFNPLACHDSERIDLVTSGVVSAFRKLFDSWGPRLENLLRYAAYAVVEQGGDLHDMLRLLTDRSYRERLVSRIADQVVRSFWINEFASWPPPYRSEAVSSVTNKIMPFLTDRRLRALTTGLGGKRLDLRRVLDERKILVVNVSRGRLGQDNSALLGSLLLTGLEQAALSRADIPEDARVDHILYLDEFQSLLTPSTSILLSEARKYRLSLVLSHQMTRQLDPATYHSVVGNCGTLVSFRIGVEDAELLAPALSHFPGHIRPEYLTTLPNYSAYARLLVDGSPAPTCSIRTLPPPVSNDHTATARILASNRDDAPM